MKESFYSRSELKKIGFKEIGKNVLISKKASFYNHHMIKIGNNVRIDDFCIISGNIELGSNVHISAGCYLFGGDIGIEIEDFVALSSRTAIYAISDDYSGNYLTNPTVPDEFRKVEKKKVIIKKHSIIGTGSTILPGVTIQTGCAIGSMSLVNKSTKSWGIYVGIPCKRIKERSKKLLLLEKKVNG